MGLADIDVVAIYNHFAHTLSVDPHLVVPCIQQSGILEAIITRVVSKAQTKAHFPLYTAPGPNQRLANVMVLGHASGGLLGFAEVACRCTGGYISLASALTAEYTYRVYTKLQDMSRPVLIIQGELDGVIPWFYNAKYALDSATVAAKYGKDYAAMYRPVILVPGMNHGQSSNNVLNKTVGDLSPDTNYDFAVSITANAISEFITVHRTGGPEHKKSVDSLLELATDSAWIMEGYLSELGYGEVMHVWEYTKDREVLHDPGSMLLGAGALVSHPMITDYVSNTLSMHPGTALQAEKYVIEVQQRVLDGLGPGHRGSVTVKAEVHTDIASFANVDAHMAPLTAFPGVYLLQVHVLVRHRLDHHQGPVAPEYWLKIKSCLAVSWVLKIKRQQALTSCNEATASSINREVIERAFTSIAEDSQTRYRDHGFKLAVAMDRLYATLDITKVTLADVFSFLTTTNITIKQLKGTPNGNVAEVTSPVLLYPPPPDGKSPTAEGARYYGTVVMKVMSVAQALEWIQLAGFREDNYW